MKEKPESKWIFEPGNPAGVSIVPCAFCGSDIHASEGMFYRREYEFVFNGETTEWEVTSYTYACFSCGIKHGMRGEH